jgi:hypothetical protein
VTIVPLGLTSQQSAQPLWRRLKAKYKLDATSATPPTSRGFGAGLPVFSSGFLPTAKAVAIKASATTPAAIK